MSVRELAVIVAAAAFTLASMGTVNLSEVINVKLPAQYATIFDQTPSSGAADEVEAERRPVRLRLEKQRQYAPEDGPFARIILRRIPSRG